MAELWPTTLPQKLNVQGHQHTFGDPAIRSAPAVGPSKVRPRSSAVSSPLSGTMFMSTAQVATLRTFYNVTVRGSDVFVFPDPENNPVGNTLNCRFVSGPSVSATLAPGMWAVNLPMEVVP